MSERTMAKADTKLPLLVTIRFGDSLWLIGGGNLVEIAANPDPADQWLTLTARPGISSPPQALDGAECTARVLWRDDEELSISGTASLLDDQRSPNYSITIRQAGRL